MKYFVAFVLSLLLYYPANASPVLPSKCMEKNMTIQVGYNVMGRNFEEIQKKLDEYDTKMKEYAKEQKLTRFELRLKNYSMDILDQPSEKDGLQYRGNSQMSYIMGNTEEARKFYEFLFAKKVQVSFHSGYMYKDGSCVSNAID